MSQVQSEAQTEMPLNVVPLPIKREFVSAWNVVSIGGIGDVPSWSRDFFGAWSGYGAHCFYPESVKMNDLRPFFGRKTRITIEVIE